MSHEPKTIAILSLLLALLGCDGRQAAESPAETAGPRSIDDAILAADRYFVASNDRRWPEIGILTQFVRRKFGDVVELPQTPFPEPEKIGNAWIVVSRFADHDYPMTVEEIVAHPNPINQVSTVALYCDVIPLPPTFLDTLRRATDLAGIVRNHAVMATQWAIENGCLSERELPDDLRAAQVEGLVELADSQRRNFLDQGIEAVAFLMYIGRQGLVRDAWIDQILRQQNADGGWGGFGAGSPSDPHASMLALWVLLEKRYPGRKGRWLPSWGED